PTLAAAKATSMEDVASRSGCLACHSTDKRVVGPAFKEVATKYRGDPGIEARLVDKVRHGGGGAWGSVPMPPSPALAESDARALVRWVLGL
ncbi:MAG TPA: c-type cytochrome, partial [Usitatibacter sp.]